MSVKIFTIPLCLFAFMLMCCNNIKKQKAVSSNSKANTDNNNTANSETVVDNHNSKTALDWKGSYNGILPCADCEGLETIIELKDSTYVKKTRYLGKSDKTYLQIGSFTWNKEGNIITLSNMVDAPNQYMVGENRLTQLDIEGNKITGKLASKYVLEKFITVDIKNESSVINKHQTITDTKWELIQLMGKPIQSTSKQKILYIEFFKQGNMAAFAGCNGIGGKFVLGGFNKITFSNLQSTLKACNNMETEKQLLEALQKADNYTIRENKLSLNKARMAPLAIFTKVE